MAVKPAEAIGHDVRDFDDNVLAHLVGMPERRRAGVTPGDDEVIRAHGLAGRLLRWTAERCARLETRLVMQNTEGAVVRALRHFGTYLKVFEALLERPRYLVVAIAITFVVIL